MLKLVEEYLSYLHNTKQVSENTFKSYGRDLKKLVQYLENCGINDFGEVDDTVLNAYMEYLKQYGYASATITRSFIAIKSIFTYLCGQGYMNTNPVVLIKLPKAEGSPNLVLNKTDMERLLNPPVVFSFKGLRDRAMLLVLYHTKIAISELVKLKVSAVDLEENKLIILHGTQKREHEMDLDMREALETFIRYRKAKEEDWLFPNRYGNPMSRQGFWKTIKNYTKEIGIDKEITLYSIKQGEL